MPSTYDTALSQALYQLASNTASSIFCEMSCPPEELSPTALLEAQILENRNNLTALHKVAAPSWVPSPELRGTTSILWSCIITLVACIYTALHLNVPSDSKWSSILRSKGKWVLVALLAPEIVLYLALSQFLEARSLAKELNALVEQRRAVETGQSSGEISNAGQNKAVGVNELVIENPLLWYATDFD
jgi:hypothetical protein